MTTQDVIPVFTDKGFQAIFKYISKTPYLSQKKKQMDQWVHLKVAHPYRHSFSWVLSGCGLFFRIGGNRKVVFSESKSVSHILFHINRVLASVKLWSVWVKLPSPWPGSFISGCERWSDPGIQLWTTKIYMSKMAFWDSEPPPPMNLALCWIIAEAKLDVPSRKKYGISPKSVSQTCLCSLSNESGTMLSYPGVANLNFPKGLLHLDELARLQANSSGERRDLLKFVAQSPPKRKMIYNYNFLEKKKTYTMQQKPNRSANINR